MVKCACCAKSAQQVDRGLCLLEWFTTCDGEPIEIVAIKSLGNLCHQITDCHGGATISRPRVNRCAILTAYRAALYPDGESTAWAKHHDGCSYAAYG